MLFIWFYCYVVSLFLWFGQDILFRLIIEEII